MVCVHGSELTRIRADALIVRCYPILVRHCSQNFVKITVRILPCPRRGEGCSMHDRRPCMPAASHMCSWQDSRLLVFCVRIL